jgi:hypothetical protein
MPIISDIAIIVCPASAENKSSLHHHCPEQVKGFVSRHSSLACS